MARRHDRRSARVQRDYLTRNATLSVLRDVDPVAHLFASHSWPSPYSYSTPAFDLSEVEDNRQWSPHVQGVQRYKPAKLLSGTPARLQVAGNTVSLPSAIGFQQAHKVVRCIRRNQRRQVLHALRKTGKGSGRGKKTYNAYSNIRCK